MMVGIDQPRQHHVVARLEERCRCLGLAAPRHQFDDPAILDHDATFRAVGENGQGILDPDRMLLIHNFNLSPHGIAKLSPRRPCNSKTSPIPSRSWRWSCKT